MSSKNLTVEPLSGCCSVERGGAHQPPQQNSHSLPAQLPSAGLQSLLFWTLQVQARQLHGFLFLMQFLYGPGSVYIHELGSYHLAAAVEGRGLGVGNGSVLPWG